MKSRKDPQYEIPESFLYKKELYIHIEIFTNLLLKFWSSELTSQTVGKQRNGMGRVDMPR